MKEESQFTDLKFKGDDDYEMNQIKGFSCSDSESISVSNDQQSFVHNSLNS